MAVYEIRPSPGGKGLGVFATQPISRGFRIVCEKPIMTALREPGVCDISHVHSRFGGLSLEDQGRYLALHAAPKMTEFILSGVNEALPQIVREQVAKAVAIFETNAFKLENSTESGTSGVFVTASRFNHSCTPNANQDWNSNIGSLTVHAVRDLEVHEEITVPYVRLCSDRRQRQLALEGYGFECGCFACDMTRPDWQLSENRRRRMYRLGQDLCFFIERKKRNTANRPRSLGPLGKSLFNSAGAEDPLIAIKALVELLLIEGLVDHELAKWYHFAAAHSYWMDQTDPKNALYWARKALEVDLYLKGDDHNDTKRIQAKILYFEQQLKMTV